MHFVVARPEVMVAAADDVTRIGATVSAADAAAAEQTTALATAGADEVSVAVASLFSAYGQAYQALSAQAAAFPQRFAQALNAAGDAYAGIEATGAALLQAAGQRAQGAAGVGAASSASALPDPRLIAAPLTNAYDSLGNGVALILGGTGTRTPSQQYADLANALYLQPHGFTGATQVLTTPELWIHKEMSYETGAQILTDAIMTQIQGGHVDAQNPVVVFGYSQSSGFSTSTMQQLHALGVPSGDVHFVMVGNPVNPNGGLRVAFGLSPGTPTPNDLYPADIYTLEYDGIADFPRYPIDVFSDLNAIMGIATNHLSYLRLDPGQITQAIPLQTSGDALVHYYMIPSQSLPLLEPLRLIPIAGQPLYDLLEPDTRILVNLGYGSIAEGWNQGPANVVTPFGLFPTEVDWCAVPAALVDGAQQGLTAFVDDLLNPATYRIIP